MKLPTSSSVLIATLAVSSSSSCLAAPAGLPSQDTDLSKHPGANQTSCMPSATPAPHFGEGQHKRIIEERSDIMMERSAGASHLERRNDAFLNTVLNMLQSTPMLGPIITQILSQTSDSTQDIDPQNMAALQSAIQEVSRALALNLTLPTPAQGAAGSAQSVIDGVAPSLVGGVLSNGDDTNAGAGSSSSASSGAPASGEPSSPSLPVNPSNTPSIPPGNSGLPIPV